jgi:hypothetical protein
MTTLFSTIALRTVATGALLLTPPISGALRGGQLPPSEFLADFLSQYCLRDFPAGRSPPTETSSITTSSSADGTRDRPPPRPASGAAANRSTTR